jgi:5-methylcytosine-specific restriction protein A
VVLPPVDRTAFETALRQFDDTFRASPDWGSWESNAAQRFALVHNGLRYPPKKIISLATGVPVSSFSGGRQSNEYLRQRGFDVVPIHRDESGSLEAPRFVIGKVYDRWRDINEPHGGGRQSGIAPSSRAAAIFLFTGETGEQYGYRDDFDMDGVFWYTGEGQVGDMQLTKGNLAITTHAADGRALHVFQSLGKAKGQRYVGEFTYVNHTFRRGPDRERNDRRVIIFHLVPVGRELDEPADHDEEESTPSLTVLDLAQARTRALTAFVATEGDGGRQAMRTLYARSKAVKDYVLLRAAGECESCREPAPFERSDGTPYLEPHHTTRVSDGGLDHPRFVGALCPTCHREIHHGRDGKRRNAELTEYLAQTEPLT